MIHPRILGYPSLVANVVRVVMMHSNLQPHDIIWKSQGTRGERDFLLLMCVHPCGSGSPHLSPLGCLLLHRVLHEILSYMMSRPKSSWGNPCSHYTNNIDRGSTYLGSLFETLNYKIILGMARRVSPQVAPFMVLPWYQDKITRELWKILFKFHKKSLVKTSMKPKYGTLYRITLQVIGPYTAYSK
jgi:hypothetical protein